MQPYTLFDLPLKKQQSSANTVMTQPVKFTTYLAVFVLCVFLTTWNSSITTSHDAIGPKNTFWPLTYMGKDTSVNWCIIFFEHPNPHKMTSFLSGFDALGPITK